MRPALHAWLSLGSHAFFMSGAQDPRQCMQEAAFAERCQAAVQAHPPRFHQPARPVAAPYEGAGPECWIC